MTKPITILFLIAITFTLFSCTSFYVGKKVDRNNPMVCSCPSFPTTCSSSIQKFDFNYEIKKLDAPDSYSIKGTATLNGAAAWDMYSRALFRILLIKEGVIMETIGASGGMGNLNEPISFSKTFSTNQPFDAVLIRYNLDIKDDDEESTNLRSFDSDVIF